jgi:hypothetical protein
MRPAFASLPELPANPRTPKMHPSLKDQRAQITGCRRKLQLAVDAEYVPGEANAAFRKQFGLQGRQGDELGQPFSPFQPSDFLFKRSIMKNNRNRIRCPNGVFEDAFQASTSR